MESVSDEAQSATEGSGMSGVASETEEKKNGKWIRNKLKLKLCRNLKKYKFSNEKIWV